MGYPYKIPNAHKPIGEPVWAITIDPSMDPAEHAVLSQEATGTYGIKGHYDALHRLSEHLRHAGTQYSVGAGE